MNMEAIFITNDHETVKEIYLHRARLYSAKARLRGVGMQKGIIWSLYGATKSNIRQNRGMGAMPHPVRYAPPYSIDLHATYIEFC